jgi:hypothetical protein
MSWGLTATVTPDDSKGCSIMLGTYSLEALSLPQVYLAEC